MEDYIRFYGTHYDVNLKIGQLFKNEVCEVLKDINFNAKLNYLKNMLEFLNANHQNIYQEVLGRAKGAEIQPIEYLAICSYEIWDKNLDKCTDIFYCDKTTKCILHNEDGDVETKLIKLLCHYEDETIFDLACFDTLHGSTFTANKFLSFSINYIYNDNYNFDGIPTYLLGRIIASCKSIKEVKKILKTIKICGSISINLFDNLENKMYSIEMIYDKYVIKEISRLFFRTNHIINDELSYMVKLPKKLNTTFTRYKVLSENIKMISTLDDAKKLILFNNGKETESVHQGKRTKATIAFSKRTIKFLDDVAKSAVNYYDLF